MSHSIPEPSAVIIKTDLGTVFHTADWKLDEHPLTSAPTDVARLKALGRRRHRVLCDSTNAIVTACRPRGDVAVTLD
jgi:ribonuclease J